MDLELDTNISRMKLTEEITIEKALDLTYCMCPNGLRPVLYKKYHPFYGK